MNNRVICHCRTLLILTGLIFFVAGCGVYSFRGSTTAAETIVIEEFFNNTDLAPASIGEQFTNELKNYLIQNSNLSVVRENGQLQMEGEISDYRLTPIAPTSTGDPNEINTAALTRLTITVKVTYINTVEEEMSFENKSFSFYQDFPNDQNLTDIEESLIRRIFERIINDIFNASVANW